MPSMEQEARAFLAASKARQATPAPAQPSAAEAADTAAITADYGLPGPVGVLKGMLQPGNVVRAAGQALGAAHGVPPQVSGAMVQPLATGAQRAFDAFTGAPHESSYIGDLAYDATTNAVGDKFGEKVVGPVAEWVGSSWPVQKALKAWTTHVMGDITPAAREAVGFGERVVDDLADAVNRAQQGRGLPLSSRSDVLRRVEAVLPTLQRKGMLTIPEATTGSLPDSVGSIAEGTIKGRGTFEQQRRAADDAEELWPKVFAATIGDAAQGPDDVANMAVQAIGRGVDGTLARAGRKLANVERVVGQMPVAIDEGILHDIGPSIDFFAKRMRPGGGQVVLDAERIDGPLKASIALVEKATGRDFDLASGQFVVPPNGQRPPQPFTFADIKTLRGNLRTMAESIPGDERRVADATLSSLNGALADRQREVLRAADTAAGNTPGTPRSLEAQWDAGRSLYKHASDLRHGFEAKGWVEALDRAGQGSRVIGEVWPDGADIGRIGALRDLMGGPDSPYWKKLARFKTEEMLNSTGGNPKALIEKLTSPQQHSADYWETTLGKDQYDRLLDFARLRQTRFGAQEHKARMLGNRLDAGMVLSGMEVPLGLATGGMGAPAAAGKALRVASWFVSNKKIAEWLTSPKDSAMFQSLLTGGKVNLKGRAWLRDQTARAIADASKEEQPDIRPVPLTTTRANFAQATGRVPQAKAAY